MAINLTGKKAETKAPVTMVLELALYNRYVRQDILYEKGQAYEFTEEQAKILLRESDEINGMAIWRLYRAKRPQQMIVEREVKPQDMTGTKVAALPEPEEASVKGIHIGDDSEIADLLPKDDDEGVTV